MENKYFVCSNTYLLKNLVHPKNIRYCYLNPKVNDDPSTILDFEIETSSDFYNHIIYFKLVTENDIPKALFDIEGNKLGVFQDSYDFFTCMKKQEYNYYFIRNHKEDEEYFKSIADAGIAVQEWKRKVAEYEARELIISNIEGDNE